MGWLDAVVSGATTLESAKKSFASGSLITGKATYGAPPPPPPPVTTTDFGPDPFSTTQAGILFEYQQQQNLLAQQQANALELQRRELAADAERETQRLAREREKNIAQLQADREITFAALLRDDPVRATLFALGYGPDKDVFDVRAQSLGITLGELRGARELEATQESALSKILGRAVDIGTQGVQGLSSAQQAARAFVQGGADIQTLLKSAFGVGSLAKGEQPGLSAARLQELIAEVTPAGVL